MPLQAELAFQDREQLFLAKRLGQKFGTPGVKARLTVGVERAGRNANQARAVLRKNFPDCAGGGEEARVQGGLS